MDTNAAPVARNLPAPKLVAVRRTPLPAAQRQPFRVLQTPQAPAQLSLFLRPAGAR